MKEILTMERIQQDLLSSGLRFPWTKKAIRNFNFFVTEDICEEYWKEDLWFVNQGKTVIMPGMLRLPVVENRKAFWSYISQRLYRNAKYYFVYIGNHKRPALVYDCDCCTVDDSLLRRRAQDPFLTAPEPKKVITAQVLAELAESCKVTDKTLSALLADHTKPFQVVPMLCCSRHQEMNGELPDEYYGIFGDGKEKHNIEYFWVEKDGEHNRLSSEVYGSCRINELCYVAHKDFTLFFVFSGREWTPVPGALPLPPVRKPLDRPAYLKDLAPFVSKGLAREIYGNERVSVVNCANSAFGITDYRVDQGKYLFAIVALDTVQTLFRHPEALPLIMAHYGKRALDRDLEERLTKLAQAAATNGPGKCVNLEMEDYIQANYTYDIFEPRAGQ